MCMWSELKFTNNKKRERQLNYTALNEGMTSNGEWYVLAYHTDTTGFALPTIIEAISWCIQAWLQYNGIKQHTLNINLLSAKLNREQESTGQDWILRSIRWPRD